MLPLDYTSVLLKMKKRCWYGSTWYTDKAKTKLEVAIDISYEPIIADVNTTDDKAYFADNNFFEDMTRKSSLL